MFDYSEKGVEDARKFYTGKRIKLISMTDPWTKLKKGDMGTCTGVDDMGHILMKWDCGSSLSLIRGEDSFVVMNKPFDEEKGEKI